MKPVEVGIMPIISLKTISTLPSMVNSDGAALVLCPLILMMLWKIGKIGYMRFRSGNVG